MVRQNDINNEKDYEKDYQAKLLQKVLVSVIIPLIINDDLQSFDFKITHILITELINEFNYFGDFKLVIDTNYLFHVYDIIINVLLI